MPFRTHEVALRFIKFGVSACYTNSTRAVICVAAHHVIASSLPLNSERGKTGSAAPSVTAELVTSRRREVTRAAVFTPKRVLESPGSGLGEGEEVRLLA